MTKPGGYPTREYAGDAQFVDDATVPDNDPHAQVIPIERREVIGQIILSHSGSANPLDVAFEQIAQYLKENVQTGQGMAIQFNLHDHSFNVNVTPLDKASEK